MKARGNQLLLHLSHACPDKIPRAEFDLARETVQGVRFSRLAAQTRSALAWDKSPAGRIGKQVTGAFFPGPEPRRQVLPTDDLTPFAYHAVKRAVDGHWHIDTTPDQFELDVQTAIAHRSTEVWVGRNRDGPRVGTVTVLSQDVGCVGVNRALGLDVIFTVYDPWTEYLLTALLVTRKAAEGKLALWHESNPTGAVRLRPL